MPVYYFVVKLDQKAPVPNPPPLELADIDEAWEEATMTTGEMVRDLDGSFKPGSEWSIEVRDASHKPLRTIRVTTENHELSARLAAGS